MIRDNRIVFGAGWIDNIEDASGRKVRYRCPSCTSTDFKHRTRQQFSYRCATCTVEFDVQAEEELTVQVFTANYSRTWRPADSPFLENALDTAYIKREGKWSSSTAHHLLSSIGESTKAGRAAFSCAPSRVYESHDAWALLCRLGST